MSDSASMSASGHFPSHEHAPETPKLPIEARRHAMVAELRKRLIDRCGFTGGRLVLGVSGGADSLALLIGCCAIRSHSTADLVIEPIAVHVHHHLRESADADAEYVVAACERLGVPCTVEHVHVPQGGNLSAEARLLRYDALVRSARRHHAAAIVVAHHAEDQLETMLMALGRGAGLDGLAGMASRRMLDDQIALLRPLLAMRKAVCESLCVAAGMTWRDDPSNVDVDRARARVRHEVLPVLESLWPDAARRAAGTADLLQEASRLLETRLQETFGPAERQTWPRDELKPLPISLIAAGIHRAVVHAVPETHEKLTQRNLFSASEAVADDERRPRTIELTPRVSVSVCAKEIALIVN